MESGVDSIIMFVVAYLVVDDDCRAVVIGPVLFRELCSHT